MKKFFAVLLTFFFVTTQAFAGTTQPVLSDGFVQMAKEITGGGLTADQIVARSQAMVLEAQANGVTSEEFLATMSEKMALNMTTEEVAKTVADLKTDHSSVKVNDVAQSLEAQSSEQGFIMVLVTFALLSILWIAIFFALADNPHPGFVADGAR